jgi:RNA polymerase sigma-70 factor (ECF subfamily)
MNDFSTVLPNELILVTQATADATAFATLYDHYFSRVYNYVRYRLQDVDTADDITAQVFERVLNNLGSYRPEKAPFSAWLFAIARNAVNDHLRSQRRRRWLSLDTLWGWSSSDPQPVDMVAADEVQAKLLAAVARLGSRERDLIGLKFAAGLTNRRIAELTGLSHNNVGIILYRAVRQLRAELKAQGVEQ